MSRCAACAPAVVLDAAILLEAGWDNLCDLVVFVDASQPVRLHRVARDRGWTAEVLQSREAAQWPRERKLSRADIVIHNDSSLEILDQNVDRLFRLATDRKSLDSRISGTSASSRLSGSASISLGRRRFSPATPDDVILDMPIVIWFSSSRSVLCRLSSSQKC